MGVKKYIKRGFKYIATGHIQPVVKAKIAVSSPDKSFKGKNYIITGGSSGLGFEIAKTIVSHGGRVLITGRDEEKLKSAKKAIGANCAYVVSDIGDTNSRIKLIDDAFHDYGQIDGLINNAGISLHEWDFLKVDEDKFDSQFLTNLKGSYFTTQEYIKKLLEHKKGGNVLFISSERGSMCDDLPYGLTKAAINSLVKALSYKYYKDGIRINAIAPGITATPLTNIDKQSDLYCNTISGRFFVPEEVAETAIFLLGDYSGCISGEIIHTNGGNHIKRGY